MGMLLQTSPNKTKAIAKFDHRRELMSGGLRSREFATSITISWVCAILDEGELWIQLRGIT
jgi:hypothetical protein